MRREVKDKTNVKKDANTVHQVNRVTWKIIKFYLALVYVFIVLYLAVFMLQTASSVVEIQNATNPYRNEIHIIERNMIFLYISNFIGN